VLLGVSVAEPLTRIAQAIESVAEELASKNRELAAECVRLTEELRAAEHIAEARADTLDTLEAWAKRQKERALRAEAEVARLTGEVKDAREACDAECSRADDAQVEIIRLTEERDELVRQIADDHSDPYMALHLARARISKHQWRQRAELAEENVARLTNAHAEAETYARNGWAEARKQTAEVARYRTTLEAIDKGVGRHYVLGEGKTGEEYELSAWGLRELARAALAGENTP
jgi:chromosome segregation ATPase